MWNVSGRQAGQYFRFSRLARATLCSSLSLSAPQCKQRANTTVISRVGVTRFFSTFRSVSYIFSLHPFVVDEEKVVWSHRDPEPFNHFAPP